MTVESLIIIKMMVDEGLTVEEVADHFGLSTSEIQLINQYINRCKDNKKESKE